MPKRSAGILLVDRNVDDPTRIEFLLVHPGGPLWAKRDDGAWSIPKGEYLADEDPLAAALREFEEELGLPCPDGERIALGEIKQPGGKLVSVWCVIGRIDTDAIVSNTFEMVWPPRSGRVQLFPEIDRAAFMSGDMATLKILAGQRQFIDRASAVIANIS